MSVPQIITVNSEQLEAQIRELLPSQAGFGNELQATNVITPIIDLTPAAEGSNLPVNMQTALSFGSVTFNDVAGATATLESSGGFYRVFGTVVVLNGSGAVTQGDFKINDGSSDKQIYSIQTPTASNKLMVSESYDFVVFLAAGHSLKAVSNDANCIITVATRQIATVNGTLVQPAGFVAE